MIVELYFGKQVKRCYTDIQGETEGVMDMNELKKNVQEALPDGLILDESVLEKIVGGINTGMTRQDLDALLAGAGIAGVDASSLMVGIAKPAPGGLGGKKTS